VQDGDPYALAGSIILLFEDHEKARKLSKKASEVARERHNPIKVIEELVSTYQHVIDSQ
jgi:glycosyltransferase involved in cell wall biosynthesis